MHKKQCIRA